MDRISARSAPPSAAFCGRVSDPGLRPQISLGQNLCVYARQGRMAIFRPRMTGAMAACRVRAGRHVVETPLNPPFSKAFRIRPCANAPLLPSGSLSRPPFPARNPIAGSRTAGCRAATRLPGSAGRQGACGGLPAIHCTGEWGGTFGPPRNSAPTPGFCLEIDQIAKAQGRPHPLGPLFPAFFRGGTGG